VFPSVIVKAKKRAPPYVVVAREGGRSSIPETLVIEPRGRGVLDTPPARGTTAVWVAQDCFALNDGYHPLSFR